MKKWMCICLMLAILLSTMPACGEAKYTRAGTSGGTQKQERAKFNFSSSVSGYYGEKFIRSNGFTYPFMFDEPLSQCVGFTLEFEILEVTEGNLEGNFLYEAYIHTVEGKWQSVELFRMEGTSATVKISLNEAEEIDGVAVVCGKKGELSYEQSIKVRNPVYE